MTITQTADCELLWCLKEHDGEEPDERLHYGRRTSVDNFLGDNITVVPYRFDGDPSGSCIEVGASCFGHSEVPLAPADAVLFSKAITAATDGHLTDVVTVSGWSGDCDTWHVQVFPDVEIVRLGREDWPFRLIKMAFFNAGDSPDPVIVQARDADADYYAKCILAAVREVTR